ncbi:protein of unknown function DUF676, lipase-like [Dillenia turbinata]|uniref:DUF676 domain-containing protein n=1 Tax=Dillenia turbinata TaxID=194707 RepID=A0AAN8W6X2_9MAGN
MSELEMQQPPNDDPISTNETGKRKKRRKSLKVPKFACFRSEDGDHTVESRSGGGGSFDVDHAGERRVPTHLVVTVNGIIGSAKNWRYAAKQFVKRYPHDVIVHCSERNTSMLTFGGVDVMGDRLADEVKSVVGRYPDLTKISFVAHSLGGLIARYAIARLYGRDPTSNLSCENGDCKSNGTGELPPEEKLKGKIAGLEPINFITSATPHLGSRWHGQVPMFCGFNSLEKTAHRLSWLLGRTGKHLFLTDGDEGKPPLLLQMVKDSKDLPFISALQSFRRRVAYANACYDYLVGWSTSSLRHKSELPKRQNLKRHEKYPHVVNVESEKTSGPQQDGTLEANADGSRSIDVEEEMLRGLTRVGWERIDVNFKGSGQRFLAHNTIQARNCETYYCSKAVKTYCINSDGADVIFHMIDNFLL